ncbi:MAG: 2-dehydropantoate 2-reductase [Hyphomicrobiales bacterium]|nr:2-dehydropantoate 2-reductase [Hyphomicrobiales bacterium]
MKICIVGAGAIGGLLAVKLHAAGQDVSIVARGPHLAAIKASGLKLIEESGETVARLEATSDIADLGPQDVVVLGLKAHQVSAIVEQLPTLYGPQTMVLTAQNGIPWWYFFKVGGPFEGRTLQSVDPGGRIAAHLPIERVIASVVYPAAEIISPGVIKHIEGNRFSLAEVDNTETPRLKLLSETLRAAGFKAPIVSDVRAEIWTKLWGNMSFNPISALTHSTLEDLCRFPLTRALVAELMREAQNVGEKLGIRFRIPIDKRIAGGEAVGAHKTSMLQDVEAGRMLEADALLGSVIELARLVELPTPHLDSVFALVKLLDHELQKAHGRLRIAAP